MTLHNKHPIVRKLFSAFERLSNEMRYMHYLTLDNIEKKKQPGFDKNLDKLFKFTER